MSRVRVTMDFELDIDPEDYREEVLEANDEEDTGQVVSLADAATAVQDSLDSGDIEVNDLLGPRVVVRYSVIPLRG